MNYRPEIDGLRAIAVIAVVLYHAEIFVNNVNPFKGGFIGVDIFFVISGYLITSIILKETQQGSFSFGHFYERRSRRILPALFTVMTFSIPAAWIYMLPKAMKEYAGSVLSALFFGSNFWFWKEDSYWAEPSALKPFLHTWSLSVEEQFYVVFPVMLLMLSRFAKNHLVTLFVIGFFFSLFYAQYGSTNFPEAAFYLLPTRGWELLAGAILAKLELDRGRINAPLLEKIMPAIGLLLIAQSIFIFDDKMIHPSVITALPVFGTMALIWFTKRGEPVTAMLSSKPMVGVGLISYSLYLWHFPIFAFARISEPHPSPTEKTILIAFAMLLAVFTYYLIERNARNAAVIKRSNFIFATLFVFIGLIFANVIFWKTDGLLIRLPDGLYKTIRQMEISRSDYWDSFLSINPEDFSDKKTSIVVIGNSFALDMTFMINYREEFEVYFQGRTGHGCSVFTLATNKGDKKSRNTCAEHVDRFDRRYGSADLIILADDYSTWNARNQVFKRELENNIGLLRKNGFEGPIVIYGQRPTYKRMAFDILNELGQLNGANQFAAKFLVSEPQVMRHQITDVRAYYESIGVYYYSPVEKLCDDDWCYIVTPDNKVIYYDGGHFSKEGSLFLANDLANFLHVVLDASRLSAAPEKM